MIFFRYSWWPFLPALCVAEGVEEVGEVERIKRVGDGI
jgi:hypothetical protein